MAQFGVLRHCLRLLFGRKQDASQQAPNDDTHPLNPPRAVRGSWIVLDLGEQHASRADQTTSPDAHAPTGRRETAAAVGPLRRPWVYSRFTMSTYQRHARVAKGATAATQRAEKSVNPLRMNPVSVEAPVNPLRMNPVNVEVPVHSETMVIGQLALRGDDLMSHAPSEAGESETSSIEAPRRHSQGPAWESDVLSDSLRRSSSLDPTQSLLTTRSMFGDKHNARDHPLVPSEGFGSFKDNGSSGTSRAFHGSYYNYYNNNYNNNNYYNNDDNTATIEPLIREIDEFLDTLGARRPPPGLLVDDFRRRRGFVPSAEPLPLSIVKKKNPGCHGRFFSPISAERKPKGLYTIKEKETAAPPLIKDSALSDSLCRAVVSNDYILHASAVPAPLRIVKVGDPHGTWPFRDESDDAVVSFPTHQGTEEPRRPKERLASSPATDSQQIGPLFDESSFGRPVIPLPACCSSPPRLTLSLFSEPDPLPYTDLDPEQSESPEPASVREHDATNDSPPAASYWEEEEEEDSISFLLDPIEDEPYPRCRNPVFYESAVHAWLEDSICHRALLHEVSSESNDGSRDDLGLSGSRGNNMNPHARRRRLPQVPRPPSRSQHKAAPGSGHLSETYLSETYLSETYLSETYSFECEEEEARDLDEQLRLRAQAPPCRIFLWTLHHSSRNAESQGLLA